MTHNTEAELLSCPFCGTDAKAVNSYEDNDWRVECWNDECSVHGKICQNRSDAALEWNRRAPAVPVPPDVVRDACARMCDARAESLQAGNMFTAANEAFKCAMAIRTHPAYQHHLRAAMLAAAPQPPEVDRRKLVPAVATPDSSSVVSDEDIARAFEGTNFGTDKHRDLLHVGVLKKACQYHCGHTITTIMRDLGLIRTTGALTKKGVEMLRIAYHKQMIGGV